MKSVNFVALCRISYLNSMADSYTRRQSLFYSW